jgi:tRNA-specific 2-thiouridylase
MKNPSSINGRQKVFVGMSGGVDSSVSALLLKQATPNNFEKLFGRPAPEGFKGYDVTGVFIKVWQPDFIECTWKEDRLDAMRVASVLDIPFVTLDLEKEYKEGVIDYMIDEYRKGRTPNPDVMCNREVKFGAFYRWAKEQDADYVATGHYCRIQTASLTDDRQQMMQHTDTQSGACLMKSQDENKDQTYFLWTLSQEIIPHVLFPIGHIEKSEVRVFAEKHKLPVATKKDSQGLCFVGTIDIKTLLKQYIDEKNGEVRNEIGDVIGNHSGSMFLTIGERHGFTITKKSTDDAPYFIIAKDSEKNVITVSHTPPQEKRGDILSLTACNWTQKLVVGNIYDARARYRAPLAKVKCIDDSHCKVISGELVATPGQSLVLYDGEKCIGGGILD